MKHLMSMFQRPKGCMSGSQFLIMKLLKRNNVEQSPKLKLTTSHHAISVSVCSNVRNVLDAKTFVNK